MKTLRHSGAGRRPELGIQNLERFRAKWTPVRSKTLPSKPRMFGLSLSFGRAFNLAISAAKRAAYGSPAKSDSAAAATASALAPRGPTSFACPDLIRVGKDGAEGCSELTSPWSAAAALNSKGPELAAPSPKSRSSRMAS
jgi:hypothetical protein